MRRAFLLPLFLVFISSVAGWSQTADEPSLGDVAREYRKQKQGSSPAAETDRSLLVQEMVADMSASSEEEYASQISDLLVQQKFEALERSANLARSRQSRFPGGAWKLFVFYQEGVGEPAGGDDATEAAWEEHLWLLKRWEAAYPQSVTAKVALAHAYMEYGFKARGGGYADSVSDEGWGRLGARADEAKRILLKAKELPAICPYWYIVMQRVALAEGWHKIAVKQLIEEGIQHEPSFYHLYRVHANYLLPKWYGEPGEVEAFATQIADRIGGAEGNAIYFELVSVAVCDCGTEHPLRGFSWTRAKEGYSALERLYGTSNLKLNRYALIATKYGDQAAAREAFSRIGERWDAKTWRRKSTFDAARVWAHTSR